MKVIKKSEQSYAKGTYGIIKLVDSDGNIICLSLWNQDFGRLFHKLEVSFLF